PVHLGGQQLLGAVALGVELFPGDVGLRIPLERLRAPPQLPYVGHRRGERQRIALLEDVGSGALLVDQHDESPLYTVPSSACSTRGRSSFHAASRSRTCVIVRSEEHTSELQSR